MISPILNVIKYFDPQIDLTKSPCHRELTRTETFINLVTQKNYTSIVSKVIAVSTLILGAIICLIPTGFGVLGAALQLTSYTQYSHIGLRFLGMIGGISIPLLLYGELKKCIESSYSKLYTEKKIVDALGGQAEFDRLPKICTKEIHTIPLKDQTYTTENLVLPYPQLMQLGEQRLTSGIDSLNRPFICMHIKSKAKESLQFIEVILSHEPNFKTSNYKSVGGYVRLPVLEAALIGDNVPKWLDSYEFNKRLDIIRSIWLGTHPEYELVKKQTLLGMRFTIAFLDADFMFI